MFLDSHALQETRFFSCQQFFSNASTSFFDRKSDVAEMDEMLRISSFVKWSADVAAVSAVALARAGFTYTGQGDKVACLNCLIEIEGWHRNELSHPKDEHKRRSPNCSLAVKCFMPDTFSTSSSGRDSALKTKPPHGNTMTNTALVARVSSSSVTAAEADNKKGSTASPPEVADARSVANPAPFDGDSSATERPVAATPRLGAVPNPTHQRRIEEDARNYVEDESIARTNAGGKSAHRTCAREMSTATRATAAGMPPLIGTSKNNDNTDDNARVQTGSLSSLTANDDGTVCI